MGIEIGQIISHYKIIRKLGHGGMGDVYLAENTRLGLQVALKFLASELTRDPNAIKRLEHEARAVAELSHPNISRINDIEEADGHRFLVLEYLDGETLSDRIQRGPLPVEETIRIGKALAEGLAHAHARGIVHRDIKASNVMMAADGGVKIMDFGLARMADTTRLTEPGTTLGTVSHMSPEQASGKEADERSDLWSLGVVLYQCLTGRLPFEGESAPVVLNRIGTASPAPPTSLRTGVPMDLDRTILRCLEKDPTLRFQHADDLLADLRRVESASRVSTSDATTAAIPSQSKERHSASRRWAALVLAIAIIAVVGWWCPWCSPNPIPPIPNDRAERPNWILVADFEGPPDDPNLAIAARELVTASLSLSKVVIPLSREQLQRGLTLAMKPDTTRVAGEVARELAVRASATAYVEGRVDRVMSGFSIVLYVKDASAGRVVTSYRGSAQNEETLISTLDRLGQELRKGIGEQEDVLRATRPLNEVITPSFDAYRFYVQAIDLIRHQDGGEEAGIRACRKALESDPDFALAWRMLGVGYHNLTLHDSARVAFAQALRRRDRLTPTQELEIQQLVAFVSEYDLPEALRLADLLVRLEPFKHRNARGNAMSNFGRKEEAIEEYYRAVEEAPFVAPRAVYTNLTRGLLLLGRYEEVREVAHQVRVEYPMVSFWREFDIALATSNWPRVQVVTDSLLPLDPNWDRGRLVSAGLSAMRGSTGAAAALLHELAPDARGSDRRHIVLGALIHLAFMSGTTSLVPTDGDWAPSDSSTAGSIVNGIRAALLGQPNSARESLEFVARASERDQRYYAADTRFLEASIAAHAGEWHEVVELIEHYTTQGPMSRVAGRIPIRWLCAVAHEQLGNAEKAAEFFELAISPINLADFAYHAEVAMRPFTYSFAHQRLVLLYSKMGRIKDARRHWEIFEKTFTNPDPELVPMVDEARRALEEAEAKAAS